VFVAFDRRVRVHVGVVALGTPPRLRSCLDALVGHDAEHEFVVSCLVNPVTPFDGPLDVELPEGVHVERPGSNLGWSGGLHRLRALSDGELFAWVQDDMTPLPGWLDALVAAADAHPAVGCFGALNVDEAGDVRLFNGGAAEPADQVEQWNETDTTAEHRPAGVTVLDWVTSKGCLTRTEAFDEVNGPDPRLWPLNHVDKDYCTHLRTHGWDVALVPDARLSHVGSQSAPSAFREFLGGWRDSWFDDRWSGPLAALAGRTSAEVEHPCAEWRSVSVDAVEALSGQAASRMLVPFARAQASNLTGLQGQVALLEQELEETAGGLQGRVAQLEQELEDAAERLQRARRRVRRLTRRLRHASRPRPSLVAGLRQRLRRLR
jgi:GT2 family glycosyltransferase